MGIFINEILPSPEGPDAQEEWIELFNENSLEADLSLWKIQDTEGRTKTYIFPKGTSIKAQGFLLLKRPETKITLNNDGDGLIVVQPDGKIIDEIQYGKAPEGKSFSKIGSNWQWTLNLTPGAKNFMPQEKKIEPVNDVKQVEQVGQIEQIKNEELVGALTETLPKERISSDFFFVFSVALVLALFSGFLVLILKKKIEENQGLD